MHDIIEFLFDSKRGENGIRNVLIIMDVSAFSALRSDFLSSVSQAKVNEQYWVLIVALIKQLGNNTKSAVNTMKKTVFSGDQRLGFSKRIKQMKVV